MLSKFLPIFFTLLSSVVFTGCYTHLSVYKYPSFFNEPGEYKSLVVDFTDDDGRLGQILYETTLNESYNYGGYEFVSGNYNDATDLYAQPNITDTRNWMDESIKEREVEYEVQDVDEYGELIYDENGYVVTHIEKVIEKYPWFTKTSSVDAYVSVIRRSDNSRLASYSARDSCSDSGEYPEELSSYRSLYRCATQSVADTLAQYITPHHAVVSVWTRDLLKVGYIAGNKFETKKGDWYVGQDVTFRVWLPDEARMNYFLLKVYSRDEDKGKLLHEEEIYWEANGPMYITVPFEELYNGSEGSVDYAVILYYSDGSSIYSREFSRD